MQADHNLKGLYFQLLLVLSCLQKSEFEKSIILFCPLTNQMNNNKKILVVFPLQKVTKFIHDINLN